MEVMNNWPVKICGKNNHMRGTTATAKVVIQEHVEGDSTYTENIHTITVVV